MHNLVRFLFFAGCDPSEVAKIQDQIDQENVKLLRIYLFLAFIFLTVFAILSHGISSLAVNRVVFIFVDGLDVIAALILYLKKNKTHYFITAMITFFECSAMFMALVMKIACHPDEKPLMLIVFGIILPMLMIDEPWKTLIIDIMATVTLACFKDACPWQDLRDIICYLSVGYLFSINVAKIRIQQFIYENKVVTLAQNDLKEKENQLQLAELNNIVSQMKPHFIYNTLATISALCDVDPQKAKTITNDFSSYLRKNINASMNHDLIPLEDELEHIHAYVNIQKARFEDLIDMEYHITVGDFKVPPLSIQPIVENAIKHGILQNEDGGKVILSTSENQKYYVVTVEDNGVGFDINQPIAQGHLGIENIKIRVQQQCNGKVDIESTIGKGTKVTIYFPKNK